MSAPQSQNARTSFIIDKLQKTSLVLIQYPRHIWRRPALLKKFFLILLFRGPYSALQNAYDFLQLQKLQSKNHAKNNPGASYYSKDKYDNFINQKQLEQQRNKEYLLKNSSLSISPKISVIVPVYDIATPILKLAINSVINQIYDNWELCLANGSNRREIHQLLNEYSQNNSKIKTVHLGVNRGISGNSNAALTLATGDFVAMLDYDDELSPDALLEIVKIIQLRPQADIIYSDEDKIDLSGRFCEPAFKPDWNPDLLLSNNYIGHLVTIRKTLIDNLDGWRSQFDGSQDYDLLLRATETTNQIVHLPKVLYHWRMTKNSTALTAEAKPYSHHTSKKTIEEALARRQIKARVDFNVTGEPYFVRYDVNPNYLVSIIIPTKDQPILLKKCVKSIINKNPKVNYEIIIVNNNSQKAETHKCLGELSALSSKIKIIDYYEPFNYSAINNYATNYAQGDILLFLNDDTEGINKNWLIPLIEQVQRQEVGAVGCKLLYPSKTLQHVGVIFGNDEFVCHAFGGQKSEQSYFNYPNLIRDYSAVTGACLMIRRRVFENVGKFDESYAVPFSDIDLCFTLRQANYLIVYTPLAQLYHLESASRGLNLWPHDEQRLFSKWKKFLLQGDPYYNPNFSVKPEEAFKWRGY